MGPETMEGSNKLHLTNAETNPETLTVGQLKEQFDVLMEQLEEQLYALNIKGNDDPERSTSRSTDNATRLISVTANMNPEFTKDVKNNVEASRTTQEHEQPSDQLSQSNDRVHHSSANTRHVTRTEPSSRASHTKPDKSDQESPAHIRSHQGPREATRSR